jgi:type I restriction enzyme, S subunit
VTKGKRGTSVPPVASSYLESDFPEGWAVCTMGDVSDVVGGGTPKASDPSNFSDNGHPWITPADLSGFTEMYIRQGSRSLSDQGLKTSSAKLLPPGTVLMSSRAPIGYLAIAATEVSTNQGFKSFVCKEGVHPKYVYYWLKFATPLIEEMGSGSTFAEVSGSRCREISLLLAPTSEQKRIAKKVEELLARVNAARERLARVPTILKRFRQSVLVAACSGRLTADWREQNPEQEPSSSLLERISQMRAVSANRRAKNKNEEDAESETPDARNMPLPNDWLWCRVEDIATVRTGGTPSRKDLSYWGGKTPWVSSGEVANCRIAATRETITSKGMERSNARVYPSGTVLMAMIGEGKTRGQTAILDIEAATNQNVAALVFDAGNVEPEYIWYWALGEYEKHRAGGRGGNYPALNGRIVRKFFVPLPPLAEQQEVVRRISSLFHLVAAIDRRIASGATSPEKLTQAILAKAFRGELVPQDPNDEPATVLLERIRATLAEPLVVKRGRKSLGKRVARSPREKTAMAKSRHDDDVKGKPYLAGLLREGGIMSVEELFRRAELPVTDFYKQLAWEVENGHILDDETRLEAA